MRSFSSNDERQIPFLEKIPESQTGLAAADNDGSERLIDHWS